MDPAVAKQQITERVKQANKFLVTVSNNPTLDQLAACIGLTLLLNKMGKHATAVFSGKVPSALEFLQPQNTIQPTTDSLRDFIISLDKNKADKLRYKIEEDVVRIFITPYRTSLSEKDLVFSEGDFNVEVVIALGIKQRTQIDQAITAHGRILHDATVISVNTGQGKAPDLGQINWQDSAASSLCEMLVSISESFGAGLIDNQMATAFLTGIVAETQRFSNPKTSPKVMTMSAQLMAAGANQQLIVSKLEPPPPPPLPKAPPPPPPPKNPPQEPPKPPKNPPPAEPPKAPAPPKTPPQPPLKPEGVLEIHDNNQNGDEIEVNPTEIHIDEEGNIVNDQAPKDLPAAQPASPLPEPATPPEPAAAPEPEMPLPVLEPELAPVPTPDMPLNLPTEPALPPLPEPVGLPEPPQPHIRDVRAEPASSPTRSPLLGNRHAYLGAPSQAGAQPEWAAPYDLVPGDPATAEDEDVPSGTASPLMPESTADGVDEIGAPAVDSARSAVEGAYAAAPFDPATAGPVEALNAQPMLDTQAPAPMANSDTPMLVLPGNGGPTVTYQPPPQAPSETVAPPPLPPPLNVAPGAIVPNLPPQNQV